MNPRYWQARTHAIGWRKAQERAQRARLDHHESIGVAFVATVSWIAFIVLLFCIICLIL